MHTVVLVWKAVNMKTVLPIYSQRVLCFCNICKIRFVAQILEVFVRGLPSAVMTATTRYNFDSNS